MEVDLSKSKLVDIEFQEYSVSRMEQEFAKAVVLKDVKVVKEIGDPKNLISYMIVGKSDDYLVAIRGFDKHTVLAKCECLNYTSKKPCDHITTLYYQFKKKTGLKPTQVPETPEEEEEVIKKAEEFEKVLEEGVGGEIDMSKVDEKKEEVKEPKPEPALLKAKLKGKLIVLIGDPLSGKTTFAHELAKLFSKAVFFKIDKNYRPSDYNLDHAMYLEIDNPKQLLHNINAINPEDDQLVVVDSITSLDAFFIPDDPMKIDPRFNNLRARFCDSVIQKLQKFKEKGTVIVICHEAIKDFKTGAVGARMNRIALRHADMVLRIVKNPDGTRDVYAIDERKPVEKPKFNIRF